MKKYNELYKIDSRNAIRVFFIEQSGDTYRMVAGLYEGILVHSKFTQAIPKNIGRANATTGEEQAIVEILARYTKKRAEGYYDSIEEAKKHPEGNFFEPMLADTWEKVNDKYKQFPLLADPKLDGMRLTVYKTEAISRNGKPVSTAQHIVEALTDFFNSYPNIRLDGELYNHDLKNDFENLMSIARKVKPTEEDLAIAKETLQFHVYDCYNYANPHMTARDRKLFLSKLVQYNSPYIKFVPGVLVRSKDELEHIKELNLLEGYEGTITRVPDSVYETKRTRTLLKHKDFITEEFNIVNILAGKGNRSGIAGTIEVMVGTKLVGCGIRGSYEYAEELLINKDNYIGKAATVRYFGKTEDGSLRFPVCIDIDRPDQ